MKNNQTKFLKLCLADALVKMMTKQDYDSININSICQEADVGRTTYYRHFNNKGSKSELLQFKLLYEWDRYKENHEEQFKKDKTVTLLYFIYENKKLFNTIYNSGVLPIMICLFENVVESDYAPDKASSYIKYFFIYGQFGFVKQWIGYGFDETPEQLLQHITDAIFNALATPKS